MKNSLTPILGVLLIIAVVLGVYFYINGQNKIKTLQADLDKAQSEVKTLKDAKAKGLSYAEYADVLIWPALKEIGATPRFSFKDEIKWMVELENRVNNLNDPKLSESLEMVKNDESEGFLLSISQVLGEIEKALK